MKSESYWMSMNADTLPDLVHTPMAKALGWTLFHSLWEGAAIAIVLATALLAIRSARGRYTAACMAMLVLLVAFAFTFAAIMPSRVVSGAGLISAIPPAPWGDSHAFANAFAAFTPSDILPWLVPFWVAGLIVFQVRGVIGWMAARRLRFRGVCPPPDEWQERLVSLAAKLGVIRAVALVESAVAEAPVVVGYLRPAILVPIGMLAGMPVSQVEAILIHELAHIRRHDYLVNLLQTAVEGFLFYHPAVWWISAVARTERENCCDDLVVVGCGDARNYAAALNALEMARQHADDALLAANGAHLMKRIRRLLNPAQSPRTVVTPVLAAGILTITATLALMAWQSTPSATPALMAWQPVPPPQAPVTSAPRLMAQATPPPQASVNSRPGLTAAQQTLVAQALAASSAEKWLSEDTVYIITNEERTAFRSLQTDDERAKFVEQFWERRNPTPGSPDNPFRIEHYRRVAYANAHFGSQSSVPGWKTDRGRIYITFGPPDEIDSHSSAGTTTTLPFEDWTYRFLQGIGSNVTVEFVDSARNGEYHMTMDPNEKDAVQYVRPQ